MSNIRCSDLFKYKVKKNIDGSLEYPKIFLMSRSLKKRGIIAPIESLIITPKFKDSVECSFTVYKENNGITLPLFDRIKDNCIIMIEGYGLFQIKISLHETDAVYKEVTGTTMQANELSQCYCKLQINTEDDIARKDYNKDYPTLFYRKDGHKEASLLHRILTYAPTYTIGHVDSSLWHINREFSCDNSTVYDFFQTVAEEVGCIFVFSRYKREINVFDLEDHCANPECHGSRRVINGVCQKCKSSKYIEPGYGLDASTYLDTHNLLEEITDTIDADSIKNCFKLVAGDDTTTNLIGQRLIGNSPYIWTFSDFELEEFSDELREKWLAYQPYVDKFQEEFDSEWDIYNDCVNKKLYWKSGKMPAVENPTVDSSDPLQSCKNIFTEITSSITYTATSKKNTVETTITSQVLNYAKLLCPEGYEVSYQTDSNGKKMYSAAKDDNGEIISFTSYLYICLKNCKDDLDSSKDKYFYKSDAWTIPVKAGYNIIDEDGLFTTDYFLFMKQQVEVAFAKADITYEPKYDTDYDDGVENHLNDPDYYKNYFREYGISRLTSFKEAYDTCTVILLEQNASLTENSEDTDRKYIKLTGVQSAVSLYDELSGRYLAYSAYIEDVIAEYTKIYNEYESKRLAAKKKIDTINTQCNLKTYLGDDLYNELLTFKREDTYENKNFSSDVVDEATLMGNIEEFLIAAKNEIAKACQPKHEISVKMAQLLTISDYESVMDAFAVGNYVRTRINGELAKMRIISIPINFTDIEQSDVTFSDTLVGNQQLNNLQEQFQKAASLATSFSFVQKQSERNDSKINKFDEIISDGLDATKNMIMNSEDQEVIMDSHGLLARSYDANSNSYEPEQSRWNKDGIIFTDNNWDTIKTALGKIYVGGEWKYGLIADYIIGNMIAGKNLTITDGDHSVVIDQDGITLDGGAIKWKSKLPTSSIDGLDDSLQGFIKAVGDLQSQIDGEITTWFEDYDPTDKNEPAFTWISEEDKVKHEGDLFYNTETGGAFRYIYNSSTKQHEWSVITDTAISRALENAKNAQDTADGKRRVFTVTPYIPYDVGDLWAQGSNGDLYRCVHARTDKEKYTESDWEKATKYTDDSALTNFIEGDYKKALEDIGAQIDGKAISYYQDSMPHPEYKNVADNDTYNTYVGDLWYDTKSNKTYMYIKTVNESNYDYTWKYMDVPKDLYDTIDGIATIYVTLPSDPNVGDILIPNADIKSDNTTYYADKVYKYTGSEWKEIKYTDDEAWKNWISDSGEFGKYKSDIQSQLDGKSETTYGGSTPPTNPETGDLWFCTNGSAGYDANKAYMFDGTTWQESNGVPDSVWDIADGKSSIFVTKPAKAISSVDNNFYHKNDLWILESDDILTGHTKGTVMVATADSTTFNVSDWTEKVKYTDDTKANAVEKSLTDYKKEIADFQTQVDSQFSVAGVTRIGQDYVFAPKIAAGYMYITKDGCSVQIDPAQSYDPNNDKIISVTAKNEDVFYVNRDGDAYLKGIITATGGSFANGKLRIDDDGLTLKSGQSIKWETDAPVSSMTEEYLLSTSATDAPAQNDKNWSTTAPSWADGKYMWKKTTMTDTNGVQDITIVCLSGATGQKGKDGENGKDGVSPTATITKNGDTTTITITDKDGTHTETVKDGINGENGKDGNDGKDAYTIVLSNESHTFAGSIDTALAGNTTCVITAYKGITKQNVTIGTVTGAPSGMSVLISNNGSTNATLTITVTTAMQTANGTLTIPITIDGQSFTKTFAYAVAFKGATGAKGDDGYTPVKNVDYFDGINGKDGTDGKDGTSSYTWIRYATDVNGSNMTATPSNSTTYIGTAVTTTNTAPTASAYTWSKYVGDQGVPGEKGDDGDSATTYYIQANTDIIVSNMFLKYSTSTITQCFSPYQIIVSLYKRVGDSATMTPYNGYIEILEESDNMSNRYFSSSAESSTTYTMVNKETTELTCCMYASDGKTKLDSMTIPVIMSDNIVKTIKQYNLSSSKTEANGIQWIDKQPTWSNGNYIWTRSYTKYESGYEIIQDLMYDDGLTQTLQDFTDFNTKVDTVLNNALPYTVIGDDYIISPKIGGGYLDIANANYRVQIDPNNSSGIFRISNKSDDSDILGIDAQGNGYFTGAISIEGDDGNLDRMQVHAIKYQQDYYTRQDYEKFYSGNNIAVSNATEAIVVGHSAATTWSEIIGWSGGTYTGGHNSEFELNTKHLCLYNYGAKTQILLDSYYPSITIADTDTKESTKITKKSVSTSEFKLTNMSLSENTASQMVITNDTSKSHGIIFRGYGNQVGCYPETDNLCQLGGTDKKWYAVHSYAFNGASDRKLKTNIHDLDPDWSVSFINAMKPSSYQFKESSYGKTHTGFIAQDVERAMLDLGMKRTDFAGLVKTPKNNTDPENNLVDLDNFEGDDENYEYSLRYDDFIAPLVSYCQYLYTKNKECEDKNQELENKLNKIYEKLGLSD